MDRAGGSPSLDRYYYLSNFESVLSSLAERYSDLLSPEELAFMTSFRTMPRVSRALLVRMAMRKGDLFRASRLRYSEIGDTGGAAAPLAEAGWVDASPNLNLDELQRLLTKEELVRYCSILSRDRQGRKADLVERLRARAGGSKPFRDWCTGSSDSVYRLLAAPLCERFRLMFFGNFHQDWSEFVLADLGIFAYEKVGPPRHSRAFRSRAEVEAFQRLHRCSELLHADVALEDVARTMPPRIDCDWLEDRRHRLLFQIARRHERAGDEHSAAALYSNCESRGARLRLIRIHERSNRDEAARVLCTAALAAPEDEAERQQLRRILPRLNRKLGIDESRAADASSQPAPAVASFQLVLEKPASGRAVEWEVRDVLARQMPDATAHYVENGLIVSMFGLLCWRAIFAPVAGAFFHDFHHGPADLSSGRFYRRREHEFAECLAELDEGRYAATIRRTHAEKMGIQSPFVHWNLVSESLLERALECFPAVHLKHWFEWIVRDVRLNRAGFPDLVQFWPKEGRYRMVEVKGPGDRLQDNQLRLLEFCAAREMPVAVCNVRWSQ